MALAAKELAHHVANVPQPIKPWRRVKEQEAVGLEDVFADDDEEEAEEDDGDADAHHGVVAPGDEVAPMRWLAHPEAGYGKGKSARTWRSTRPPSSAGPLPGSPPSPTLPPSCPLCKNASRAVLLSQFPRPLWRCSSSPVPLSKSGASLGLH